MLYGIRLCFDFTTSCDRHLFPFIKLTVLLVVSIRWRYTLRFSSFVLVWSRRRPQHLVLINNKCVWRRVLWTPLVSADENDKQITQATWRDTARLIVSVSFWFQMFKQSPTCAFTCCVTYGNAGESSIAMAWIQHLQRLLRVNMQTVCLVETRNPECQLLLLGCDTLYVDAIKGYTDAGRCLRKSWTSHMDELQLWCGRCWCVFVSDDGCLISQHELYQPWVVKVPALTRRCRVDQFNQWPSAKCRSRGNSVFDYLQTKILIIYIVNIWTS